MEPSGNTWTGNLRDLCILCQINELVYRVQRPGSQRLLEVDVEAQDLLLRFQLEASICSVLLFLELGNKQRAW